VSAGPQAGCGESDGGKEVARELVEAGGDAPGVLELAEEALDQVALPVDAAIDGARNQALARSRNVGFGAGRPDQIEQRVGVVAAVGDDMAASEAGEQIRRRTQIVRLSGGQHEPHWQAVFIDDGVDLGAQSATRTADGAILAPPFFRPRRAGGCESARNIDPHPH
jgi:hypothetical protein